MLERLDEINTNDFVPKWIDSVKKANSYKELLDSEIK